MAKKQVEIPNHTTDLTSLSNTRTLRDFIENDSFMLFPEKDDWRKRFNLTLLEWASKDDSVEITDFAIEMKMRRSTIYEWAAKYPDIKETLDHARLVIGSRRRKGALTRKYDKDVVFKDMHKYDPEWLDINKYHSDMKKDEDKQSHTFIIQNDKPRVVSKEELAAKVDTEL